MSLQDNASAPNVAAFHHLKRGAMPGSWVEERAQFLVGLLGVRGLTMSLEASRVLVANQVEHVCQQVGLTERAARAYMTDEALRELADSVAFSLVEEFPGADLHTLARTVAMPVAMAGVTLSALAETLLFYLDHGRADSIAETPLRELTVMLSLLGLFIAEGDGASIALPPAFLVRMARKLETAAIHPGATSELSAALRRDAAHLRALAS
jgi:hypothetical protein